MARFTWPDFLAVGLVLGACGTQVQQDSLGNPDAQVGVPDGGTTHPTDAGVTDGSVIVLGGADAGDPFNRPYGFHVPPGYDPSKPTPLVILLHGYSAWGEAQNIYFGLSALADANNFLLAFPDGTTDATGFHFWNATDGCCNFYGSTVDDVAYLSWLIGDVKAHYNVDPRHVHLFGHSNGAFMAHRLACDITKKVSSIVALAGDNWLDWSKCNPAEPISVLQIHGDIDIIVQYGGGTEPLPNAGKYPSAAGSIASWAFSNQCPGTLQDTGTTDLDALLLGAETQQQAYDGCPSGIGVELWTIHGDGHIPIWSSTAMQTIYNWMVAHPKQTE